jgi:hypothetical protein
MSDIKVEVGETWKYAYDGREYEILRRHELDAGWRVGVGPGDHFSDSAFGAPGQYGLTLVSPASPPQHPARAAGQRYGTPLGYVVELYAAEHGLRRRFVPDDGETGEVMESFAKNWTLLAPQETAVDARRCDRCGAQPEAGKSLCKQCDVALDEAYGNKSPSKAPTPVCRLVGIGPHVCDGAVATRIMRGLPVGLYCESAYMTREASCAQLTRCATGAPYAGPERIDRRLAHSLGVEDDTLENA